MRNSLDNSTSINYTYKFDKSEFGIMPNSLDEVLSLGTNVSPNPAHDQLSIKINERQHASVRIVDQLGKEHISIAAAKTEKWDVDISQLPAGMYYARLYLHELQVADTKKFIVAR